MIKKLWIDKASSGRIEISEIKGCMFLGLTPSSPQPTTNYLSVDGLDGQIDGYTSYGTKTVTANFLIKSEDGYDFPLLLREIWSTLFDREAFYISCSDMPGIRYLVHTKPFEYTRINSYAASFSVDFDVFKGYGESWATTLDAFTYDTEMWQIGMNLPNGEDLQYVFDTSIFKVYNASDITIDPRLRHELTIAISGEGTPVVTNKTTGDVFKYNKSMKSGDVLNLTGVYPYLNGSHCGRDTNHGIITLAPGWNSFEISGMSDLKISYDFPFLYVNK